MNKKVLFLAAAIFMSLTSCKQKTEFKGKNQPKVPNTQEQLLGSFYPYVFSPIEIYYSVGTLQEEEHYDSLPNTVFPIFGGVFDKITFTLNKNRVKDKHEIDTFLQFFDPFEEGLFPGLKNNNFKDATYQDLKDMPESFRTPQLDDFCEEVEDDTIYIQHKYRATGIEGDLYAFAIIGQCDNEPVRCALIYYVPDNMSMINGLNLYEPIFDHPHTITEIMGIEGTFANCEVMDRAAYPRPGCDDPAALNYDDFVNISDNQVCIYPTQGCTDMTAYNYNPSAMVDDGSCIAVVEGCTDAGALNYNSMANTDDGSCNYAVLGCTDPSANNYNPTAQVPDGSCVYNEGCTDPSADNYDAGAIVDDGSCTYAGGGAVFGCTAPNAINYDPLATEYDGSCVCLPGFEVVFDGSACQPVGPPVGP